MYPLWDKVIAPVLRAAGAQRVVEIGALQGRDDGEAARPARAASPRST